MLNEEYGVSDAEAVDRAKRMIAAYDDVIARGLGAVTFEGKMIDVPVVEREKDAAAPGRAVRGSARQVAAGICASEYPGPRAERITILGPGAPCWRTPAGMTGEASC